MDKNKKNLTSLLKQHFGFDTFKGDQEAIIRNLLDGNDTFVLLRCVRERRRCFKRRRIRVCKCGRRICQSFQCGADLRFVCRIAFRAECNGLRQGGCVFQ